MTLNLPLQFLFCKRNTSPWLYDHQLKTACGITYLHLFINKHDCLFMLWDPLCYPSFADWGFLRAAGKWLKNIWNIKEWQGCENLTMWKFFQMGHKIHGVLLMLFFFWISRDCIKNKIRRKTLILRPIMACPYMQMCGHWDTATNDGVPARVGLPASVACVLGFSLAKWIV